MKTQQEEQQMLDELFEVILKLQDKKDCQILFDDLCTYNEINQMASRVRAAKMLMEGYTYNQIISTTDISSATLSRVARCIKRGSGGYKRFIEPDKTE